MGSGVIYLNTYGLGPLRVVPTTATQPIDPALKRGVPRQFQKRQHHREQREAANQFNSPSRLNPAAALALTADASRALTAKK